MEELCFAIAIPKSGISTLWEDLWETENVSLIPDIPTDTVTVHLSDVVASVFNNQDFMQSPFPKITEQVL
jgi:hypothetical protein